MSDKLLFTLEAHMGLKLKKRREELGMKQYDLASLMKVSIQQLRKYEAGRDKISPQRLIQLCRLLMVTPNYFFDGIGDISFSLTDDSVWLSCENLKGEKIQIFVGRLQGEVVDFKISTKGDVQ